jgi:hypothetical protein
MLLLYLNFLKMEIKIFLHIRIAVFFQRIKAILSYFDIF